jgi:hypothetical protein
LKKRSRTQIVWFFPLECSSLLSSQNPLFCVEVFPVSALREMAANRLRQLAFLGLLRMPGA